MLYGTLIVFFGMALTNLFLNRIGAPPHRVSIYFQREKEIPPGGYARASPDSCLTANELPGARRMICAGSSQSVYE